MPNKILYIWQIYVARQRNEKHKVQYVAISVDRERMNSERKTQKHQ